MIPTTGPITSAMVQAEWGFSYPFTSEQVRVAARLVNPWTSEQLRGKAALTVVCKIDKFSEGGFGAIRIGSANISATVSGGSGQYTYLWAWLSDSGKTPAAAGWDKANATYQQNYVSGSNRTYTGKWSCTVTDKVTGNVAVGYTPDQSFRW